MILHKLLFFKLPFRYYPFLFVLSKLCLLYGLRYAAQGDANGEPISRDGEGEKKLRLEKEILGYPG